MLIPAKIDTEHLIIDLRRNNVENRCYRQILVRSLIVFGMANPSNRTTFLQGSNTFSAAQNLATDIDRMTNATFVGEDIKLLFPCIGLAVGIVSG